MKGLIIVIVVIVLLLAAIVIGSQNDGVVTINYLIAKTELTISTFMAIMFALGAFVAMVAFSTTWVAMKVKITALQRKLNKLQHQGSDS